MTAEGFKPAVREEELLIKGLNLDPEPLEALSGPLPLLPSGG